MEILTLPFTATKYEVGHLNTIASVSPLSVYKGLYAQEPYGFLYESLESTGKRGRYSFTGGKPFLVLKSRGNTIELIFGGEHFRVEANPLHFLRECVHAFQTYIPVRPFSGGAVGYVSYDAVRFFEQIPDQNPDPMPVPEFYFIFPEEVVVFDHLEKKMDIIVYREKNANEKARELFLKISNLPHMDSFPLSHPMDEGTEKFQSNMSKEAFYHMVKRAKEYILAGDIFQVVLSQRFTFPIFSPPLSVYEALRITNPSPYMYALNLDGLYIYGSSPEILVKVLDNTVTIRPLAGTRPRGHTPEEDLALEKELLEDEKERAEHLMLVDLARNDIGRVCTYGTVRATELFTVERYSKVMHITSTVQGRLSPAHDAFDCFAACFPAGTVSGAPKVRAMEIIDALEPHRRGIYAGAIGYFDYSGNMDTCIAIRTVVIQNRMGVIQAGAGIVADSTPEKEYQETLNKAKALFKAISLRGGGIL